ncbi:MAG TPA: DUF4267 domain-containing protein [Solirubrobacterales bacterium]|nr:DUF4267 domain-containing protein [Solirubrobacterales bacterium]
MFRRAKIDPKARQVALQIGASRVAMGVGIFFATRPAVRWLGFGEPGPTGQALAKLGGGRDIAIGALTLAARDDRQALRTALLVSSACDLTDAVALGVSARHPETRKAGIGGVLSGGAAAIAGFWAYRRLAG